MQDVYLYRNSKEANLIPLDEPAIDVSSAAFDDLRDEDTWPGLLADDGEAEAAVLLLVELDLQGLVDFVVLAVNDLVEGEKILINGEVLKTRLTGRRHLASKMM